MRTTTFTPAVSVNVKDGSKDSKPSLGTEVNEPEKDTEKGQGSVAVGSLCNPSVVHAATRGRVSQLSISSSTNHSRCCASVERRSSIEKADRGME